MGCFGYSNCESVVLKKVGDLYGKEKEFCPRCECKNETRNTTIVKVRNCIEYTYDLFKLKKSKEIKDDL